MSRPENRHHKRTHGYVERIVYQMIVIIGVAILLAGANMLINPHSPKYGEGELREGEIRLADIPKGQDIIWVDARPKSDYDTAHVKGAILINDNLYYLQIANFLQVYNGRQTVLVYCTSEGCDAAKWVAERIRNETGAKDVSVIFNGWEAIAQSNLPTENTPHK